MIRHRPPLDETAAHDEQRLDWLPRPRRWTMIEVRRSNLLGPHADFDLQPARAFHGDAA